MLVLGINAYDHDVAACLLRDGVPVAAVAKERITRVKHDAGFYGEVVDYCLDAAGVRLEDVDLVVRNSYVLPVAELERRLLQEDRPYNLTPSERLEALRHPLFLAPDSARVATVSHHLAHAWSAFAASPFREGAVMVVDGVGSYRADVTEEVPAGSEAPPLARESESWYSFRDATLTPLWKAWLEPTRGFMNDEFIRMAGLGALYSRVSTYVFGDWNKCGEVMGLAPYGRAAGEPLLRLDGDRLVVPEWTAERRHPFLGRGDGEWEGSPFRGEWEDLARRAQEDAEEVLLARARRLHELTGAENLCIAGGVGLNCVANGRILEESPFRRVWIQPAAGDDGIALGAALYGHSALRGRPRAFEQRTAFLGRTYDAAAAEEAARGALVALSASRRRRADAPDRAAELLAAGKVVGWVQGGSEFGPRALGHRSILADPRDPGMKDHVNARVKHRQAFRPFAPAVLAERAGEWFVGEGESPFMLLARRVRPEAAERIPAVVHVDGTARVQTVRREDDPLFHALIEAFGRRTGVPVVLNTSFNLRGEPIVETPADAVECFLRSRLDALVIGDLVLEKGRLHRPLHRLVAAAARARGSLRSRALLENVARNILEE
ncbi:MAG: carbamoyltransferase [Planctomycetes bacterium]|nr:carbamoyltransferase [Planctomycetota bacterium]